MSFFKSIFSQKAKDLVCNMNVNPAGSKLVSQHDGKNYYFCSSHCKDQFDQDPKKYTNNSQISGSCH